MTRSFPPSPSHCPRRPRPGGSSAAASPPSSLRCAPPPSASTRSRLPPLPTRSPPPTPPPHSRHTRPHPSTNPRKGQQRTCPSRRRHKLYAPVFKNCAVLPSRLMKPKHSWVFNKPVDTIGLGLHDYHTIITKPMDLDTVKSKLAAGHYKSPREFAGDVCLTFQNAMTYNPKGQNFDSLMPNLRCFPFK
ncbi:transcription factor GTE2-like [Phragmites australis]|uniref:transcription factor GTE2-like n=1 Tax=Phragmites australis TaxID=29695 RepID=UPI002D764F64|nr:transcription factor GTE2-like [Phragmites australis]